jgi:tetratricopeptide (TPR) repeat protein
LFLESYGKHSAVLLAALTVRPGSAVAYGVLAYALLERGDWREAMLAANRSIKINPNHAPAYYFLGRALRDKKDLPGAIAAFQRAIDIDPNYSPPIWGLGEVARLQGDGPAAVATFQRAIEVDPRDWAAHHSLGQVLRQQGRYAEAEQAYLGAIKAQPAAIRAHDSLARLLATCPDDKVRDGRRAVEYAKTACERSGWKDPLYLDTLAAAYAEAGQFEEAVRYQTRALDDPALKGDVRMAATQRLELYRQKKPFRDQGP